MDFQLNDEQLALQSTARRYVQERLQPLAQETERTGRPPSRELIREYAEMGFLGINIETRYGGLGLGNLEALLVLAVATGISRGEVLALRWSDLDLGTQTLCIHRTVHWTGKTGYVEQEPKTPARRRTIPLPRRAGDALTQLHQQQEEEQQQRGEQWQRSDLVFSMPEGTYLAAGTLTQEIAQLLRQAELHDAIGDPPFKGAASTHGRHGLSGD